MKLIFNKNEENEINVQLQSGTQAEKFSYTKLVEHLLLKKDIEDIEYNNLSKEEIDRIDAMIKKIKDAVSASSLD